MTNINTTTTEAPAAYLACHSAFIAAGDKHDQGRIGMRVWQASARALDAIGEREAAECLRKSNPYNYH